MFEYSIQFHYLLLYIRINGLSFKNVQGAKNPPLLVAVRNACFYKALFGLNEPDQEVIKKAFKEFQASLRVFDKLFLKGGPFLGGSTAITIGDLLAANTLEQVRMNL